MTTKVNYRMIDTGAVNIIDFGAIPDGDPTGPASGTDNTDAIQAAFDYASANRLNVYVPPGIFHFKGTLTWNDTPPGDDFSQGKGIWLYGESSSTSVLMGNDHDCIDVAGSTFQGKDFALMGWGFTSPSGTEYNGRGLFDSSRPGDIFARLERVAISRCDIAFDATNGSWTSQIIESLFQFNRIGLRVDRCYAGFIKGCDFICRSAIYTRTSVTNLTIADNHFSLGTYRNIFGGDEVCIDMLTEGAAFKDNYFETYAEFPSGSIVFRLWVNQQDVTVMKGNYLNLGQATAGAVIRELNIQAGFPVNIFSNMICESNRIIGDAGIKETWWNHDLYTQRLRYTFDDRRVTKRDTAHLPLNQQKGVFNITGTWSAAETDVDMSTKQISPIPNINLVNVDGTLLFKPGWYRLTVANRVTGTNKRSRLKFDNGSGVIYYLPVSEEGTSSVENGAGSALIYAPFEFSSINVSVVIDGYSGGDSIQSFNTNLIIEEVSPEDIPN